MNIALCANDNEFFSMMHNVMQSTPIYKFNISIAKLFRAQRKLTIFLRKCNNLVDKNVGIALYGRDVIVHFHDVVPI